MSSVLERNPVAGSSADGSAAPRVRRRRQARRAAAPLPLAAELALVATTLAAVVSLCRVFPGWAFAERFVLVALVAHAAAWFARVRGWNVAASTAWWAGLSAVVITRLFIPGTAIGGLLPARATWNTGWQMIADDYARFQVTVTPVPDTGGYALSLAIVVATIAVLADGFAFRAYGRAEAVVPSALLFVVASSLGYDRLRLTSSALWIMAALLTVALLRATHAESTTPWLGGGVARRVGSWTTAGLSIAVTTALVAVVVAPRLPGAGEEPLLDTTGGLDDSTQVISPLVQIQARLVSRSNIELFTVRADQRSYWRLMALEAFDGNEWSQDKQYGDGSELPDAAAVGGGNRQEFRITNLGDSWMPSAFSTVALRSEVAVLYNDESSTLLRRNGDLFNGFSYTTVSAPPTASAAELAASTSSAAPGGDYLELPDDFPEEFRELARQITGGATNAYDQALALQDYFRNGFEYDVNVARGHDERAMETFLRQKIGYCEQFAGTFAALARSIGLASRVAVGFTPGEVDDLGVFHVLGRNAHAWPEVWFDGIGWVLFEPTPGRGAPGAEEYTGVAAPPDAPFTGADPADNGAASGAAPSTTRPAPSGTNNVTPDGIDPASAPTTTVAATLPATVGGSTSSGPGAAGIGWILIALLAALVVWVVAMPPLVRAFRAGRAERASERLLVAWSDTERSLAVAGSPRRPDETPHQFVERAWRRTGCDRDGLHRLAALATASAYAEEEPTEAHVAEAEALRGDLVASLRRRSSITARIKRRFDPRLAGVVGG